MKKRVVVTGLGTVNPLGNDYRTFFDNLVAGKSGIGAITRFDTTEFKTKFAGEVKDFDPQTILDRKEVRKTDRNTQMALAAAEEIISTSKVDLEAVDRNRFGVIWASGIGGIETFEEQYGGYVEQARGPRFNPFFISKMITDSASGWISIRYGLKGINYATVSACASSNNALIDACDYIRFGKADMILAGGSEAAIVPSAIGGFNAMKALSTRNDDPEAASRPFDVNRDGFVLSEGAAGLLLEDYEHAKARGAHIFAEVVGGGMTADAYHLTATHPEGEGAYRSMKLAIEEAGVSAGQVDYLNAHATSTGLGDISEMLAVTRVFGEEPKKLKVGATKSMTGHLLGAAGGIEAIATVLSVAEDVIPPTINTTEIDPEIAGNLQFVLGTTQKQPVEYALSNTFGFGGHNASVLFKKYRA